VKDSLQNKTVLQWSYEKIGWNFCTGHTINSWQIKQFCNGPTKRYARRFALVMLKDSLQNKTVLQWAY
jgi:hypothetical protein